MVLGACCLDFCDKPARHVCSACKEARYCCQSHQREAWKTHKGECKLVQEHRRNCASVVEELKCHSADAEKVRIELERFVKLVESNARNSERLVAAGAIETVIHAGETQRESVDVQENVLAAVFALLVSASGDEEEGRKTQLADAGCLELATAALTTHSSEARLTAKACKVLRRCVDGEDEDGVETRCERATGCGAIEAVVAAMDASAAIAPSDAPASVPASEPGNAPPKHDWPKLVAEEGCGALCILTYGREDSEAAARSQLAASAGAIEAIVRSMNAYAAASSLQGQACSALTNICAGFDEEAVARRTRANDAGAVEAVQAAGDVGGRGELALDALRLE